jgi:hypothetical protein
LYPKAGRDRKADCLNGIAFNASADTFLLTGKLWPKYFSVKLTGGGESGVVSGGGGGGSKVGKHNELI